MAKNKYNKFKKHTKKVKRNKNGVIVPAWLIKQLDEYKSPFSFEKVDTETEKRFTININGQPIFKFGINRD